MRTLIWIAGMSMLLMTCTSHEKRKAEEGIEPEHNDLPAISLQLVNGNTVDLRSLDKPTVLVMFQPDCDHCQREAVQIRDNLEAFHEYDLYFISSASPSEVIQFADEYQLSGKDRVWFGTTTLENVLNNFGAIPAPSLYIYNADGRLVREVSGEVDISWIIGYL